MFYLYKLSSHIWGNWYTWNRVYYETFEDLNKLIKECPNEYIISKKNTFQLIEKA